MSRQYLIPFAILLLLVPIAPSNAVVQVDSFAIKQVSTSFDRISDITNSSQSLPGDDYQVDTMDSEFRSPINMHNGHLYYFDPISKKIVDYSVENSEIVAEVPFDGGWDIEEDFKVLGIWNQKLISAPMSHKSDFTSDSKNILSESFITFHSYAYGEDPKVMDIALNKITNTTMKNILQAANDTASIEFTNPVLSGEIITGNLNIDFQENGNKIQYSIIIHYNLQTDELREFMFLSENNNENRRCDRSYSNHIYNNQLDQSLFIKNQVYCKYNWQTGNLTSYNHFVNLGSLSVRYFTEDAIIAQEENELQVYSLLPSSGSPNRYHLPFTLMNDVPVVKDADNYYFYTAHHIDVPPLDQLFHDQRPPRYEIILISSFLISGIILAGLIEEEIIYEELL